jgi:Uma2 family endonuclease
MEPDVSAIVTEDDEPVDNFPSEKQQRVLTEPLYSSWSGPPPDESGQARPFVAAANVGLFPVAREAPIVPDVFLSLDVELREDWWQKKNRSYFFWEIGKPPEVVIELVSNQEGDELGSKRRRYAKMGVAYYVVYDPSQALGGPVLRAFELRGNRYVAMEWLWFDSVGLGLTMWEGTFEGRHGTWLRWCLEDGRVVPTGAERAEAERTRAEAERTRAEAERTRADTERTRADTERTRADTERARAERLAARLQALGIDPDEKDG